MVKKVCTRRTKISAKTAVVKDFCVFRIWPGYFDNLEDK